MSESRIHRDLSGGAPDAAASGTSGSRVLPLNHPHQRLRRHHLCNTNQPLAPPVPRAELSHARQPTSEITPPTTTGHGAYAAFLFDMDGTVVDSIASANRVWRRWAASHGLDPEAVLRTMHGVRAVETVRRLNVAGMDPEHEAHVLTLAEIEDVEGIVAIKGAKAFLQSLPPERWAIVTSAPRVLAHRRLAAAGLPTPRVLVTADDVAHGKPAPDCYLQAARLLGVAARDCLVWEDAPAGVLAAEAAGSAVMVVSASLAHPFETSHPVITDYDGLKAVLDESGLLRLHSPA
jgi:sugar-phosphatase